MGNGGGDLGRQSRLEDVFAECDEAISNGKGMGAVLGEAEYLLGRARVKAGAGDEAGAREDATHALEVAQRAQRDRVASLLQDVRELFAEEEGKGTSLEESRALLTKADEAFEVLDLALAVDLMNQALHAMLESSLLVERSKQTFLRAKDLIELARPHLPLDGSLEARLDESRDLYRHRKYQESLDLSEELVSTTEALLVESIHEVLEGMRSAVDRVEATGVDVDSARKALGRAWSLVDIGESLEALDIARSLPDMLETLSRKG